MVAIAQTVALEDVSSAQNAVGILASALANAREGALLCELG